MPLTPADIHHVDFGRSSIGKRGYDEEQVDALLDEVSQEMIRLLEENERLARRAESADEAYGIANDATVTDLVAQSDLSVVAAELDRAVRDRDRAAQRARTLQGELEQARREHARAQQSAQQPARHSAVAPVSGGNPDRVLERAHRTADDHVRVAREESHTLLIEAKDRSEQMLEDAETAARDAVRLGHDAVTRAAAMEVALRREVDRLTVIAAECQAAVRDMIEQDVRYLGGAPA